MLLNEIIKENRPEKIILLSVRKCQFFLGSLIDNKEMNQQYHRYLPNKVVVQGNLCSATFDQSTLRSFDRCKRKLLPTIIVLHCKR
jgi:hypothetical protein